MPIIIRPVREADRPEWLRLRRLLWPECPEGLHAAEMDDYLGGPAVAVFVAEREGGGLGGFVETALRPDAEGCGAGPVGYVEGWFVDADLRRRGVGRQLVRAAEEWAGGRGCREMASDAEVENAVSRAAHAALGYLEVIRLAHFRKPLAGAAGVGLSEHRSCPSADGRPGTTPGSGVGGDMATMLEVGRRMVRGEREPFPVARLVGLVMREVEPGRAVFELQAGERHHNPLGTLHGGVYCDLADAAMGWAYAALLAEGESFSTVELKINFLRAVSRATLTAEAKVVKAGSTLGYVECEVKDGQGRLVAKASSTCLKLKRE